MHDITSESFGPVCLAFANLLMLKEELMLGTQPRVPNLLIVFILKRTESRISRCNFTVGNSDVDFDFDFVFTVMLVVSAIYMESL